MNNKVQKSTELSALQYKVASMLASGMPISVVASKCELSRNTIYKWLRQDKFNDMIESVQEEMCQMAKCGMLELSMTALTTLQNALNSKDENVRIKVAMWLMDDSKYFIKRGFIDIASGK